MFKKYNLKSKSFQGLCIWYFEYKHNIWQKQSIFKGNQ